MSVTNALASAETRRTTTRRLRRVGSSAVAVLRTTRPRQWTKNLLVLAAPFAAGSLGPREGAALHLGLAFLAFTCASSAVYLVNDAVDAERDRQHPRKRSRPVASGALGRRAAVAWGAVGVGAAEALGLLVGDLWFTISLTVFLGLSFLYSAGLKNLPAVEVLVVASGFLLRGLGGAAAAHVPPSVLFTLVYGLGALMVVTAKRANELASLDISTAVNHRPSLRAYTFPGAQSASRLLAAAMVAGYVAWAAWTPAGRVPALELLTVVPLVGAVVRFEMLVSRRRNVRVEDLLMREPVMIGWELAWLVVFAAGNAVS